MGNDVRPIKGDGGKETKLETLIRLMPEASDLTLLQLLDQERNLFVLSDKTFMQTIVDELIRRKVYPEDTVEGNPNSVFTMVEGWGAYWNVWKGILICPHCNADLRDYKMGPPGLRQIGVIDRGLDKISYWICPDCKGTWGRTFTLEKPE
jgi:hypothetical protein